LHSLEGEGRDTPSEGTENEQHLNKYERESKKKSRRKGRKQLKKMRRRKRKKNCVGGPEG
jgi:hypothetical protein